MRASSASFFLFACGRAIATGDEHSGCVNSGESPIAPVDQVTSDVGLMSVLKLGRRLVLRAGRSLLSKTIESRDEII